MNITDIVASLQKYWTAHGPQEVTTMFSGTSLDVSADSTWMEFWLSQIQEIAQRSGSPQQISLLIDVHLFSRDTNKRAINTLVDETISILRSPAIPIHSSSDPTLEVGQLRCHEPTIRDFSRTPSEGTQSSTQHLVLSLNAIATQRFA